jgi:hypothetical protein
VSVCAAVRVTDRESSSVSELENDGEPLTVRDAESEMEEVVVAD